MSRGRAATISLDVNDPSLKSKVIKRRYSEAEDALQPPEPTSNKPEGLKSPHLPAKFNHGTISTSTANNPMATVNVDLPPRSMPKQWVDSKTLNNDVAKPKNAAVIRYDLFRDTFKLGSDGLVLGSDIDARFHLSDSFDGDYTIKIRGPGMMGPFLDNIVTTLPDTEERGSRPFFQDGGFGVCGLEVGREYWVEVVPDPKLALQMKQELVLAANLDMMLPTEFDEDYEDESESDDDDDDDGEIPDGECLEFDEDEPPEDDDK